MSKESRQLAKIDKIKKLEKTREDVVKRLAGDPEGNGNGQDHSDYVHRVLGAVYTALHHPSPGERGVKTRSFNSMGIDPALATSVLDRLTRGNYPVLSRQSGGIYTVQVDQGSDGSNYLAIMVHATDPKTTFFTAADISRKFNLDQELTELMLDELSDDSRGGKPPLMKVDNRFSYSWGYF